MAESIRAELRRLEREAAPLRGRMQELQRRHAEATAHLHQCQADNRSPKTSEF